jgi:hypothetical protein
LPWAARSAASSPRARCASRCSTRKTISKNSGAAALRLFGATKADLGDRLWLLTPSRTGMLIEVDRETRKLRHTALMAELLEMLGAFKPDLLILDPLVELHDAQENDNTALRHVIAEFRVIARMQDIAILLLHHTPKGDPRPGDQDAGRGALAIGGVLRKSFTLFEMTEAEAAAWKIASRNSISGSTARRRTMTPRMRPNGSSACRCSSTTAT